MKVGLIIKKTFFNNLLALTLACMVSLLFTQSMPHVCKSQSKQEECFDQSGNDGSKSNNKDSKSNKPQSGSSGESWIGNIAVLNSSEPVFQTRTDFLYFLNLAVIQHVTIANYSYNPLICKYKVSSPRAFSIPIFYCQLLI